MSYCRWSSDDYQCDVYVYADVQGGYTTHVGRNRPVYKGPLPPPVEDPTDIRAWLARHEVVTAMFHDASLVDIGGPHDGETFNDPTPGACADRLEALRAAGYNVPQDAIDALRDRAAADPEPETEP